MYLTQGLHRVLQQRPNALATVFRDRRQTYAQLADRVARLASALQQRGMHTGDRVGLLGLNCDRFLEYYLATWWGGGVVNPVNIRWTVPEIAYSLDDCDTRILMIDDTFLPMAEAIASAAKVRPLLIHIGDGPAPKACCLTNSSFVMPSRSMMPSVVVMTWPASCTPVAPPAGRKA